ncbi:MAG TPA: amidase [Bryobacteraceae bacterium]|nr:amidase [Bryobacteraceae bacterium]
MQNIEQMAAALRARKVSSRELVEEALRRIAAFDARLNSFLTVTGDLARAQADALDEELEDGQDRGMLHGIPIAHKDLVRTKGVRTTAGSKIFADYVPKRDAAVVAALAEAGAISIGKTGLHEFAYGITSNNPHYGAIHNPWDVARIPGGSSGGSAAAVAAGIVPLATGTDTGGSIRVPASFCGVVGFKPTFGRINTLGVLPLGETLDHVGPMTRTVRGAAIAFQLMATNPSGYVPPGRSLQNEKTALRGMRIGVPRNYFFERVDAEVASAVERAIETAAGREAKIVEIEVPDMAALTEAGATCLLSEAAAALRPYLDRRSDFGEDVLGRLDQGRTILAVDYLEALRVRRNIGRQFTKLWERADCLLTPTTPMTAPKIGQSTVTLGGVEEEVRAAGTRFTRGMNALGLPAISIPCGFSQAGLPIGLQAIAGGDRDDFALRIAAAIEDALELAGRMPPDFS